MLTPARASRLRPGRISQTIPHSIHRTRPQTPRPSTRFLSSAPPLAPAPRRGYTLAFACVLSGTLGYFLATRAGDHRPPPSSSPRLKPQYGSEQDFVRAVHDLRAAFASSPHSVSTDPDDLDGHGASATLHNPGMPHTVVVYPRSTEDVVQIVKIANAHRMPVIPYSGATSLEGQITGNQYGGICVDVSRMDKILQIHDRPLTATSRAAEDSDLVCQPGVGWMEINETLQDMGIPLFFPLDPAPSATIGGMLSTGCSGTNAVRYGTAKAEWFLNATVVLPSGEVIKTRQRSRKSSAGFDVTKLFIGAEGTLGIFPNVRKASEAVIEVLNRGAGIQCVELCDAAFMDATNLHAGSARRYAVADHLFFKLQGPSDASLAETAQIVERVVRAHGGENWALARDPAEAESMWADRKNAHYSGLAYGGKGARGWATDVCVPISKLPQLVHETQKDIERAGIVSTIVGHAGDGNFHTLLIFKNEAELEVVRGLVHRMVDRAIALEGTCTGEHGVGVGKREYLNAELGEGTVKLMKAIKDTLDPLGLFNPGKLYPDDEDERGGAAR
ncbi:FAD-binding domain-containing protein [Amylostereum chailletii]|nr:FAD-binding domain-containing protein [Amylostereum chailletii]